MHRCARQAILIKTTQYIQNLEVINQNQIKIAQFRIIDQFACKEEQSHKQISALNPIDTQIIGKK